MKKTLIVIFVLLASLSSRAQNLQVLYDFADDRKYVTTTLEMFKPDKWGSTFYFVDFYYDYGSQKHPSSAYMEIARNLNFWKGPLNLHVEYNGGLGTYPSPSNENPNRTEGYPINNAWLGGVDYGFHNADFSKTLNLQAMYKHIVGVQESAQFTGVWGLHFLKRKLSFTGFADLWWEDNAGGSTIFVAQPQLWYNFSSNLSAGSEVEVANNFAGTEGFKVRPRLAVKWNF